MTLFSLQIPPRPVCLLSILLLVLASCGQDSLVPDGGPGDAAVPDLTDAPGPDRSDLRSDRADQTDADGADTGDLITDGPTPEDPGPETEIGASCEAPGGGFSQGTCSGGQLCLPEEFGFEGGYCTRDCSNGALCPGKSQCVDTGQGFSLCFQTCELELGCERPGYICQRARIEGVCAPDSGSTPVGTNNGAACVTPEVQAPGAGTRTFGASRLVSPADGNGAETFLAARGGKIVVAYIDIGDLASAGALTGISYSGDDGQTWTVGLTPLVPVQAQSDPVVAVDAAGTFWVTWLGFDVDRGFPENEALFVARSSDGGASWDPQVVASAGDIVDGRTFADKPWIAASADGQTVVVTYSLSNLQTGATEIHANRSGDGGATWSTQPLRVDSGGDPGASRNLAQPVLDEAGNLHVAWVEIFDQQYGSPENLVRYAQLPVEGQAFAPAVTVSGAGDSPVFNDPSVSVVGSRVHVGFTSGQPTGAWDIRMATSTDGGATFGASVKVNDDPSCASHFLHAAVVDSAGRLHVAWYDNRYLTGNVMYARSTDQGASFSANEFVNDSGFEFTTRRDTPAWPGDYLGLAVDGNRIYAAWGDPRGDGVSRIYFASGTLP